jgi:hypothetical protein
MDGMAPLLLFLVFGLLVAAVAYHQHQRKIERQQQFSALALGHGLDFSIDDPFDTLGEPFALFRRGDGRGVEDVLWGEWNELEIRAFDYWCDEESTNSKGHTSRSGKGNGLRQRSQRDAVHRIESERAQIIKKGASLLKCQRWNG